MPYIENEDGTYSLIIPDELDKMLKVGNKIKVFYNKGNRNNRLYHVRAIMDDEYVVVKTWVRHKKRWAYSVLDLYWFEIHWEDGKLSLQK